MRPVERKFLLYQLWMFVAASLFFWLGYLSGQQLFFSILDVLIIANIIIGLPFCIYLHRKMFRKIRERVRKDVG